jgi:hypothetical protein
LARTGRLRRSIDRSLEPIAESSTSAKRPLAGVTSRVSWGSWVGDAYAVVGLLALTWLVFGSASWQLGHYGDSWSYMSEIEQGGPYAILPAQRSRLALPWAWALGFAIAGSQPFIYHLLAGAFIAAAAACLYFLLAGILQVPRLVALSAAALSILWPADPTRYDVATLGNRQALFFFFLGCLLYLVAWRRRNLLALTGAVMSVAISLLTYEAHLFLVAALPLLLFTRNGSKTSRWLSYAAAAYLPLAVWGGVNAAVLLTSPQGRTYQTLIPAQPTATRVLGQLVDGLKVLLVDAWTLPVDLLSRGAIPNPSTVCLEAIVCAAVLVPLVWFYKAHWQLHHQLSLGLIAAGGLGSVLGLGVFAILTIPTSQPDRTQTFSMTPAALILAALLWWLAVRVGRKVHAPAWTRHVGYVLALLPFMFLFLSMAAVYQRNYRDTWREQQSVLRQVVARAPDISVGSLVVISGLPDSRIIFASGYTCEFALTYLYGHPYVSPALRLTASNGEQFTDKRVSCGLLFNGRDLDPNVHLQFRTDGVYDRFGSFDHLFPFEKIIVFQYNEGALRMLDQLPNTLVPAGTDAGKYDPQALIRSKPLRSEARQLLE